MKRSVRIVCRPEVAIGFALAGLRADEPVSASEATAILRALSQDPSVGLVLVEQSCWSALPEVERRALERRPLPLFIPFPGPSWAARLPAAEERFAELLRQALGYRVRLR